MSINKLTEIKTKNKYFIIKDKYYRSFMNFFKHLNYHFIINRNV